MLRLSQRLLLIVLSTLTALSSADSDGWEFVRNEENILVDRKISVNSPVVIFRGQTTMNAPISSLLAVVLDPQTQREWNNTGYDMRVLEKKSDTDLFFYSALHVPWPFRDRDFVIKLYTQFDTVSRKIAVTGREAVHPKAPLHPKRVRLPVARVNWLFEAAGAVTRVTVTFQIDAGGVLPLWLMNKVTKGMPFRGLRNIRDVIAEKKYDREFEKRFTRFNKWHQN